jgi:hypothetical protein
VGDKLLLKQGDRNIATMVRSWGHAVTSSSSSNNDRQTDRQAVS